MKQLFITVAILSFELNSIAQKHKDLDINYMLRGQIYAQSAIKDKEALGGFAQSDNEPRSITEEQNFSGKGLLLKVDTSKIIKIGDSFNGYHFYIANKADSIVRLDASDSRLNVVAEAFVNGKWSPIEYLPNSWCGNSSHHVYLNRNQYWQFVVPKFRGKIKARIRYKMSLENGINIYSNEVLASVNKGQLTKKQKYSPNGIMDPYVE
jgi:hypothetical protein